MPFKLAFIIGMPRSGTTLLERMLSRHSQIQGGSEPHLLTPLAHLGVWCNVDKAPYDHIVAALGQQAFVERLPAGKKDYWQACRAYCNVLYQRYAAGKAVCLDKTPEYATILPFINHVFPDAAYIVLTRHPAAVFSSFAHSFFDGDYQIAYRHDPVLERYIPAMADFLRQDDIPFLHLRYEDLVEHTETWMRRICQYLEIAFEPEMLMYQVGRQKILQPGDPLGIYHRRTASTHSLHQWAGELAADADKYRFMRERMARLAKEDLAILGYPEAELWQPVGNKANVRRMPLNRYRLQRKLIVHGRETVRRHAGLSRALQYVRLFCDVLLRE